MTIVLGILKKTGENVILINSEVIAGEPCHEVLYGKEKRWFPVSQISLKSINRVEVEKCAA